MDTRNYLTLMIGHTLARSYESALERELGTYTEPHGPSLGASWFPTIALHSRPHLHTEGCY